MTTIIKVGKSFFKYQFDLEILKKINDLIEKLDIPTKFKPYLCEACGLPMEFSGHSYSVFLDCTPNYDEYYCKACKRGKTITYGSCDINRKRGKSFF